MGRRGPAATPTVLLSLRGSVRAERRKGEPKPPSGRPAKPKWLTGEAAKVWRQVLAQLESMGTLAKSDGAAIARCCDMLVQYVNAAAFVAKYVSGIEPASRW